MQDAGQLDKANGYRQLEDPPGALRKDFRRLLLPRIRGAPHGAVVVLPLNRSAWTEAGAGLPYFASPNK